MLKGIISGSNASVTASKLRLLEEAQMMSYQTKTLGLPQSMPSPKIEPKKHTVVKQLLQPRTF